MTNAKVVRFNPQRFQQPDRRGRLGAEYSLGGRLSTPERAAGACRPSATGGAFSPLGEIAGSIRIFGDRRRSTRTDDARPAGGHRSRGRLIRRPQDLMRRCSRGPATHNPHGRRPGPAAADVADRGGRPAGAGAASAIAAGSVGCGGLPPGNLVSAPDRVGGESQQLERAAKRGSRRAAPRGVCCCVGRWRQVRCPRRAAAGRGAGGRQLCGPSDGGRRLDHRVSHASSKCFVGLAGGEPRH